MPYKVIVKKKKHYLRQHFANVISYEKVELLYNVIKLKEDIFHNSFCLEIGQSSFRVIQRFPLCVLDVS